VDVILLDFGLLTLCLGLCQRRHWPDPLFQTYRTRHGYGATVRVNNREYSTDVDYESDDLAKNAAATRAYMICRNFSVNDGRDPGQRPGQVTQGLPVAIGTGRRNTCSSNDYDSASSSSGGTSPRNSDYGLDHAETVGRRSSKSSASSSSSCYCGRGMVRAFERCSSCLREAGYRV
jgi:ribosomal protein S14